MSLAPQDSALLCQPFIHGRGLIKKPGRQSALIIRITPVKLHWLLVHEWLASNWQK